VKGKEIAKKFNEKSFICNETGHQAKNYRNRAQQRNPKQKKDCSNQNHQGQSPYKWSFGNKLVYYYF